MVVSAEIIFYSLSFRFLRDLLKKSMINITQNNWLHLDHQIACYFLLPLALYEKIRHWILVMRNNYDIV